MILSQAIGEFLVARRVDGRAKKTLSWYEFALKDFDGRYGHEHVDRITVKQIRAYLSNLMDSDKSEETIKGIKRGLHAFWEWVSVEYSISNPMANIQYPGKPKQRDLIPFTKQDIRRLFQACLDSPNPERDRMIIWLLLDTGMRAQGLCGLRWKDVSLEQKTMYVVEKRKKGRVIAFSSGTIHMLKKWAFYNGRGDYVIRGVGFNPLTTSGLYQIVKDIGVRAGVPDVTPHTLRHNFAINWMASGGDIVALQKQLGHTEIQTTISYYLRYGPSQLVAAHRTPLEFGMLRGETESKKPT